MNFNYYINFVNHLPNNLMIKTKNLHVSDKCSENLREKAKKMYQHGMSTAEIAEVLEVPYMLVKQHTKDTDFQDIRHLMRLRLSHMKRLLLSSFDDLQAGKRPIVSPSKMLQYATAYEKLSDKKRHIGCWYEAYEQLTEWLLTEAAAMKSGGARSSSLRRLRKLRQQMATILQQETKQIGHE